MERSKKTQINQVTYLGMGINILLAVIKFVVGYLGKSEAVIADACHSLSDLMSDAAIIIGVRFWSRPADKTHPYGHLRIETLVTVLLGLILVVAAGIIFYDAMLGVHASFFSVPTKIALWGPLLTIVFKEFLYHVTKYTAKKTNSNAVMANAWHHRSDALSSIPVLIAVGLASYYPHLAFIDKVGAMIVALYILKVAWNIIRPRLSELTDMAAPEDVQNDIQRVTKKVAGVSSLHAVRTRKHGDDIYVDLHIQVDPTITVKEGHDIARNVKKALIQDGENIIDVVVHVEPHVG